MRDPGQTEIPEGRPSDAAGDESLMEQACRGCRESFAILVRRHQSALLNFFRRLGAYNDAEDLVQETFVRLYRYRDRYRVRAKFTTFLYTIARHAWIDLCRRASRRDEAMDELAAESADARESGVGAVAGRMDVEAALGRLPEKLRSVVVMSVYQGLRYEQIASALRVPLGTVKSRMFVALRRLREYIDDRPRD